MEATDYTKAIQVHVFLGVLDMDVSSGWRVFFDTDQVNLPVYHIQIRLI